MKYCSKCGTELVAEAVYCQECGEKLPDRNNSYSSNRSEEESNVINSVEELQESTKRAVKEYGLTVEHITEEMILNYYFVEQIIVNQAEKEVEKKFGEIK